MDEKSSVDLVQLAFQLVLSARSSKEGKEFMPSVFIGSNKVKNVVWIGGLCVNVCYPGSMAYKES